jgi:outer membrane protein assembly factor BamB
MYLRDPSHSSFDRRESLLNPQNAGGLTPLWRTSVGGTISTGVTVSHGVLFFGAWDGNFYSFDASTGAFLWARYLGKAPDPDNPMCGPGIGIASQPAISGDTVYAAGGDSSVYALNRYTGEILWRVPLTDPQAGGFVWSSVLLSGNSLYVGIASLADCPLVRGGVARIPLDNPSQPVIRYTVPEDVVGASVWSTPAIDEQANLLYITTGNADSDVQDETQGIWGSALLVLDATTLDIQAHFFLPLHDGDIDADWGSSPLLFQTPDGSQFVAASGKTGDMWVLHRPDLTPAWAVNLAIDCIAPEFGCGSISTPAFDGRTLFTGAGASDLYPGYLGSVYAFDPTVPNLVWSYPADGVVLAPVTVTPGLVYVPTTQGMVILDAATGIELWRDWGSAGLYGQAVVSGGRVYCTYVNGDLIAWSLTDPLAPPAPQGAAHSRNQRPPGPRLFRRGPAKRSDPGPASPPR